MSKYLATNYSIELSNYKTNIKTGSPNLLIHVCILTFWQNKLNMNNFVLSSNELKLYITIGI